MAFKNTTFLFLFFFSTKSFCQVIQYENHKEVGEIEYDSKTDNPNFKLCFNEFTNQNFGISKLYEGEKISLEKTFKSKYINKKIHGETGLIRIRFLVNCIGETDRFRLLGMNKNYQEKTFDRTITDQLLKITKSLDGWKPLIIEENSYDYYNYLIFKVKDGQLLEILP